MPVRTRCPVCNAEFTLEDRLRGKRVRCKSCEETFVVEGADDAEPEESPKKLDAIQSTPRIAGPPPRRRIDEDDEPRGRRRDPDDDDRPRRRPRQDDDDDELPSQRRRRQQQGAGAMLIWILVPTLLVVFVGAGLAIFFIQRSRQEDAVAIKMGGGAPFNANPVAEMKKIDVVQPAGKNVRLEIKDSDVKDVITNGPANTHAAVHFWDNNAGNLKKMFAVFDVAKGAQVCRFEHAEPQQMDLSADGARLAVFSQRLDQGKIVRELFVFSTAEGKPLVQNWAPYPDDPDFRKRRELAWVYVLSDKELLTVAREGQLDRWNYLKKERLSSTPPGAASLFLDVNGFGHTARHFAISPDRKTLAVFNKDGFNLYETATGKLAGKTAILSDQGTLLNFWGVAFSPDGKTLACHFFLNPKGDRNQQSGAIARWSIPDGQRLGVVNIPPDINAGGGLSFWGTNHVILWDGNLYGGKTYEMATGVVGRTFQRQGFGKCVALTHDGKVWFATGEFDLGPAVLASIDFPQQDLAQFPPRPNDNRGWKLAPAGVAATP